MGVTIVTSSPSLVAGGLTGEAFSPKFGAKTEATLRKMGVTVLTGSRVERGEDGSWAAKTDKGADVGADIVYDCTGSRPATAWAAAPGSAVRVDPTGSVLVERTLEAQGGAGRIFALGDCAGTGDLKQGYFAKEAHGPLVVANVLAAIAGKPLAQLKASPRDLMLVAIGRKGGVCHLPGGTTCAGCCPVMVKSGDLFIAHTRQDLGL